VAGIENKDEKLIKNLGMAAIEQVKNSVKVGVDLEEGKQNLLMLCVAITFFQYVLTEMQNQAESVKVGDVSVKNNKQELLEMARHLVEHYSQATKKYMKAKFVEFRCV
jgi:hypothetical protein